MLTVPLPPGPPTYSDKLNKDLVGFIKKATKYKYITISKEERFAIEHTISHFEAIGPGWQTVINILHRLLERSKHKTLPDHK